MSTQDDIFADIEWPEEPHLGEDDLDDQWPDDWPDDTSNVASPDFDPEIPNPASLGPDVTNVDALASEDVHISEHMHKKLEDSPPDSESTTVGSRAQNSAARFSKEVRSILRVWFNEHRENPYPTSSEKDQLAACTGLRRSQISLWLANTRRRYRSRRQEADDLTEIANNPRETLTPYDRWKLLPWYQEATAAPVIIQAAADFPVRQKEPETNTSHTKPTSLFSFGQSVDASQYDAYCAPSLASYETGLTSMVHGTSISDSTLQTYASQTVSSQSSRSKEQERRRRRHQVTRPSQQSLKYRPFQCTFCHDATFATKYDWQRHEKSQHVSLEKWTCCPTSATISTTSNDLCAFCGIANPNPAHLETHHYSACQDRHLSDRTFYRKDHFVQHLRLTHECGYYVQMKDWKTEERGITSRCGFCSDTFDTWQSRIEHIALHFKDRLEMSQWVGGLGLEPRVLAQVEKMTRVFSAGVGSSNTPQLEQGAVALLGITSPKGNSENPQFRLPDHPRSHYELQMLEERSCRIPPEMLIETGTNRDFGDATHPTTCGLMSSDVDLANWDVGTIEPFDWDTAW